MRRWRIQGSFRTWCGHNLVTGAVVGFVAGALNVTVVWSKAGLSLPPLASVPVSIAAGALVMWLVGVVTAPLAGLRGARLLAVALHGLATALLACVLCASVMVRALTGGYVTLGAIEFAMNAERHVMGAALGPFLGVTIGLIAAVLVVLLGAAWFAHPNRRPAAHDALGRAGLFGAPAFVILGVVPPLAVEGLSAHSPELAFVESLDDGAQSLATLGPELSFQSRTPATKLGPELAAGEQWKQSAPGASSDRPNVLLLMLESVSVKHLGYAGYPRDTSPNLDRIAQSSLRLRRAWTTATHSNYAQMAVLSSLFPRRGSGLDLYQRLDYPRVLLHDMLHQLGHRTGTISSQDEHWQGMLRFQQTATPTYFWHSSDFRGPHVDTGAELVVPDAHTVDHALDWIGERGAQPWALYLNLQLTHFPYQLPPGAPAPFRPIGPIRGDFSYVDWSAKDREVIVNRYDNAIRYVDAQVGRLVAELERRGQLDDTIIVITSDHGELFGEHDLVTHGRSLYDAEARVPLLVRWPKRVRAADVYEPVSHLDILPSVLDLMGVSPHPAFQGKSFVSPRAELDAPAGIYMNIQGLRSADALICWPWKLIADRTARRLVLHNLEQDPDERDDRAGRDVGVASEMFRSLRAQMLAQVAYHKPKNKQRSQRFAPRLLPCPALPGARQADVRADEAPTAPGAARSN
jgi:arylsulfatase A-like enzyme